MSARTALLKWSQNTESNLTGYRVYAGTSPGIYSQQYDVGLTGNPNSPNYTLGPVWSTSGKWYFTVTAYNSSNLESAHSNEVSKGIPMEYLQAARM